jgi:hypothetical protein
MNDNHPQKLARQAEKAFEDVGLRSCTSGQTLKASKERSL